MKQILALSLAATLLAGQAQALSCMRPDAARSYTRAAEAAEPYVVLLGTLTHQSGPLPERDLSDPDPEERSFAARFEGHALAKRGFSTRFATPLTLELTCAGPWCAGLPEQEGEVLAFVEQRAEGYHLRLDPCGGTLFPDPEASTVRQVTRCHGTNTCLPED
ncbi:hypothetical protein [Pseudooceanicola aestuarii]|uniref:hypothetical protein n=1 Tax=Pseudooceanicola aestuarii TaxID=2697319 RepID=UPI0013D388F3|nr:hypothetical protein [Pseudooceanicola aestuarii]